MIVKLPAVYDVSHWKEIPDFTVIDPRPLLMFTKATEGNTFVDDTFSTYYPAIQQAGYHRGCYHFHRKAAYNPADPYSQARHFCNTIRPYVVDTDILVLDLEEGGETAQMMIDWFTHVQNEYPNNLVMLYSSKYVLNSVPMFLQLLGMASPTLRDRYAAPEPALNLIQMTLAQREFMKNILVWIAGYPSNPDLYSSVPDFYIPDQTKYGPVMLWQYTGNGRVTGISGSVDCNWIDPVFQAMLEGTPPEEPMEQYVKGTANPGAGYTLRVRSGPGTTYSIIGALAHAQAFTGYLLNGWIRIDYNGQQGYIMASWTNYTVTDPPPPPSTKPSIEISFDPALVDVTLKPQ